MSQIVYNNKIRLKFSGTNLNIFKGNIIYLIGNDSNNFHYLRTRCRIFNILQPIILYIVLCL